jgi:oligosaccharide reducing-end xylanase
VPKEMSPSDVMIRRRETPAEQAYHHSIAYLRQTAYNRNILEFHRRPATRPLICMFGNRKGTRLTAPSLKSLLIGLFSLCLGYPCLGQPNEQQIGAYSSGAYPDLFGQLLGKRPNDVEGKINSAYRQLFFGDDRQERVYYPVAPDMGYILDVASNDVRTEGMSYGMMIAVQRDDREVFDRLWKWATTYMQFTEGPHRGYFAWHCTRAGMVLDSTAASDGEEWFVMSLFFASARWGDGQGIYNYRQQADEILRTMLHKESEPAHGSVTNMFDTLRHLVAFVPATGANEFTDPSYQLPHFYELWARWAQADNKFWFDAAAASRALLKRSADSRTGLCPDYSTFDGGPVNPWAGGHGDFRFDAWRVGMNVAVDWLWFAKDPWEVEQSNRLLEFFQSRGIGTYGNQYSLDGRELGKDHSPGLVAMNAVACLAATRDVRREFVMALWDTPVPKGLYRYYDGMLYMLGMLQVSGRFRIYDPTGRPAQGCRG